MKISLFVKHQRLVTPCARVLILQCDRSIYCALNTALMAASEARISGDCEAARAASGSGPRPRRPSRPCRGRWGGPRAFYQLTARSPAWRRHVTLVTCHVSILILQTLSTRLGNYWSFPFPLVWLLGYLVTCYNSPLALISSLSHFAHLLHTSNTCIHTELSFMWDNANEMLHICHSFVSLQNVAWWGFMLPVVSNISFFGARHRPGRFSSRDSNFDIELYINIHNI